MSKRPKRTRPLAAAVAQINKRRRPARRSVSDFFRHVAHQCATAFGSSWAFLIALLVVVAWAASGPLFGFSDTWQLAINTGTTIVTFLMVFLIQNAQNRDAKALHLKLDELIHTMHGARNRLIELENCSDEELSALEIEFRRLANGQRPSSSVVKRAER